MVQFLFLRINEAQTKIFGVFGQFLMAISAHQLFAKPRFKLGRVFSRSNRFQALNVCANYFKNEQKSLKLRFSRL